MILSSYSGQKILLSKFRCRVKNKKTKYRFNKHTKGRAFKEGKETLKYALTKLEKVTDSAYLGQVVSGDRNRKEEINTE